MDLPGAPVTAALADVEPRPPAQSYFRELGGRGPEPEAERFRLPFRIPPAPVPDSARLPGPESSRAPDSLGTPLPAAYGARLQRIAIVVLTAAAVLAAAWIASALWAGLLLGVLVAFSLEPAHRRLVARFPTRRTLAAGFSVTAVALGAIGALTAIGYLFVSEAVSAASAAPGALRRLATELFYSERATERLAKLGWTPEMVSARLARLAERAAEWASSLASGILGTMVHLTAGMLIAFVTAYYALKDRRPLERRLEEILPLPPRITRELVGEFRKVGRGTLIGSVLAAFVQGVFATVGYVLCGAPRPVLLGVMTAAASFLPIVGTMIVWVPVGVALILAGNVGAGLVDLLWGTLVTTSFVDYVLRPVLVGKESRSHPLLFLVGLIGGVEVLGAAGIVAGPIVMALFASVLRVYRREVVDPLRAS